MRRKILPLALLLPFVTVAVCEGQATPAQAANASVNQGHANSSQFSLIFGPTNVATLTNSTGSTCNIDVSAQQGGQVQSDFYRTNEDGGQTLHLADPAAPLRVTVNGVTYTGKGHSTVYARRNSAGTYVEIHISAEGPVTDPRGNKFQARCAVNGQSLASLDSASVMVH